MALSAELQIGKAGEHLVCCDLIQKGFNAFLSDQGLPYDVLCDISGEIRRIQVKTSTHKVSIGRNKDVYPFSLRTAKKASRLMKADSVDYIAFAFLDKRVVQYIPVGLITASDGNLKQSIWFKETGQTAKYIIGGFSDFP